MNSLGRVLFHLILTSMIYRVAVHRGDYYELDDDYFDCGVDGRRIEKFELCDGIEDCLDGSDETEGCRISFNCTGLNEFLCNDHQKCIPQSHICDGMRDCDDGSDEKKCAGVSCTIKKNQFLCDDFVKCIDLWKVCDKRYDCDDKSDEGGLCLESIAPMLNCRNFIRTPKKDICLCEKGFEPGQNYSTCEDFDECAHHVDGCHHQCINTWGSYKCVCKEGYTLQSDDQSCVKEQSQHQTESIAFLYTTANNSMKAVSSPGFQASSIFQGLDSKPQHITPSLRDRWMIHMSNYVMLSHITLLEKKLEEVSRFNVPDSFKQLCPSTTHMASDYHTWNLYIVCEQNIIVACQWHQEICTVVRPKNNNFIKQIDLSPEHGLLFWLETTESTTVKIVRSSMDGSNERVLMRKNLGASYHHLNMVVDSSSGRIFYFNVRQNCIESIKFDGSLPPVVVKSDVFEPLALGVYEEEIFWSTNSSSGSLFSFNKNNGKNERVISKNESPVDSLIRNTPPAVNSTDCHKGLCSDLCLLSSEKTTDGWRAKSVCACSYTTNTSLSVDGITCRHTTILASNLIKGFRNNLFLVGAIFDHHPRIERIELDDIFDISTMTYDPVEANVFLFESVQKILFVFNMKTHNLIAFSTALRNITSMEYDGLSNNLYFINNDIQTIEVFSLKTKRKAILIRSPSTEQLIKYSLALQEGVMCVLSSKPHMNDTMHLSIKLVPLNNTSEGVVIFNHMSEIQDHHITQMLVDERTRLIWISFDRFLLSFDYKEIADDKSNKHRVFLTSDLIVDLKVADGVVFYTTRDSARIEWIDVMNYYSNQSLNKFDLLAEEETFLTSSHLKIAPVSGHVNTSTPCFRNNGGCNHVCLIVNARTYAKRCLCEENYTLADDGIHCHNLAKEKLDSVIATKKKTSIFTYIFFIFFGSTIVALLAFIYNRTLLGNNLRYRFFIAMDALQNRFARTREPMMNIDEENYDRF